MADYENFSRVVVGGKLYKTNSTSAVSYLPAQSIAYVAVNDGNPLITLGATALEKYTVQAVYDSGAQTLDYVKFSTAAASATANKGKYVFDVDGTDILQINDAGLYLEASKLIEFEVASATHTGLLVGCGDSSNPATTATADKKFISIYSQSTATSGDARLAYLRHEIGGVAGGGECLRALTDLTAAVANANGAHISLQAGATGYVSGLGTGIRSQLYIKDEAIGANGTYYALQAEIYSEGATSSISAVTKHAILAVSATGNATGMSTVLNALSFDGTSAGDTTKMISSVSLLELPSSTVGIACLVNGTRYYIPAVLVSEWN